MLLHNKYGVVGHRNMPTCTSCASCSVQTSTNSYTIQSIEMERTLYNVLVIFLI
jgi:hypothetical protein